MKNVLLIGAGRSSSYLIRYLLDHASTDQYTLTVADVSVENAKSKTAGHPSAKAIAFDIQSETNRVKYISEADLVISLLPAHMHLPVAQDCVRQKKNLVTASYVSAEMNSLDSAAKDGGIILLNECGLDPGIDHMSAMEIIDEVHRAGGKVTSFKSYTGGLVAPESNDNPWGYKFSWNPRNVILAGQGTARFIENGKYKYIPYNRLFAAPEIIEVDGHGKFDGYANRDSLSYRKIYNLEDIPTMLRGTLRQEGFCKAWNVFVQLGLTDDSYVAEGSGGLSYAGLVDALLPESVKGKNVAERTAQLLALSSDSPEMKMVEWTGIFGNEKPALPDSTPAQILQHLLEQKWKLKEDDKDMIVMQHAFEYTIGTKKYRHLSSLVVKGENQVFTSMAKTVGLPAAIAARLILNGKINLKGVQIPVKREIYHPILAELKSFNISFEEKRTEMI
ncbi:MAG: saccharopine dehydrogenase C-terminal domain-containing protein [Bacteroidia bacterium]